VPSVDPGSSFPRTDPKEAKIMTIITRALAGLALGALGALMAAGAYTEATRAPDQP
jgi:hypothetical protein